MKAQKWAKLAMYKLTQFAGLDIHGTTNTY